MNDPLDPLLEFQRRIGSAADGGAGALAELVLEAMDPEGAELLRLCAIPHHCDADVVHVLAPNLDRATIQRRCDEFTQLSFVSVDGDGFALTNAVRRHLFSRWMRPEAVAEFTDVSMRLAEFFRRRADESQGEAAETARRRAMFHLLGADRKAGFLEFERLNRRARHSKMESECSQLIRMVHEYDETLSSCYRLWLAYHEAKLSADLDEFDTAETGYRTILDDPESPQELRATTYVRLGYIHMQRWNWDRAIECYQQGLELAERTEGVRHIRPRVLGDLGLALAGRGELERAETYLRRSVEAARAQGDPSNLALACSNVGALYLKRREPLPAIAAFQEALNALPKDQFVREGQIYTNLGWAYSYLPDWSKSEDAFSKSLAIKAKSGDTSGQAYALNGMARVEEVQGDMDAAIANSTRAIELFTDRRDFYNAAVVKYERGRRFRKMNERGRASTDFSEAADEFRALGKTVEAGAATRDLQALTKKGGLPRWVWVVMVLAVLCVVALVVGLLVVG